MRMTVSFRRVIVCAVIAGCAGLLAAQGPPGRDRDNRPPGHGGVPPGQAKKAERGMPPGQARRSDRRLPPGQAKKYFRERDRDHFYGYYRHDADRWRGRRRPYFVPGQYIARTYVVQTVPPQYWEGAVPPPPPGYRYGYVRGYVVAYNPTTRIIADVLDLVNAASGR